jgi:hypothetical protein
VDAIFVLAGEIREAAKLVAAGLGLDGNWLNDSAKGFVSAQDDYQDPGPTFPNLKVVTPTPEYMLAMQVLSSHRTAGQGDKSGIVLLMDLPAGGGSMRCSPR